MEDSQKDTTPLNVEHQATEQETVALKVEDEGSPCMYFQAQGTADVTTEENKRSVEIIETPGTEDHRSSVEGKEHEDITSNKKDESVGLPENPHNESQELSADKAEALTEIPGSSTEPCVKSEEEAICEKPPESTELQGESSQVSDDAAEKKLEINLAEESVQEDETAKHEDVLEHGEGETCSFSISEDHHSKEDGHGNQEDLPSQSNISEPPETTNSAPPAEEVLTAGHSSTETPVIKVESVVATQSHHTESPSSETKDAPDSQNDHNESLHPAESTEEKPLEVSEHGSLTAAQQDPVKAANDLEEVKSSEEQGSGETSEMKNEGCSECHKDQHTHETKEEKEVFGL